MSDFSVFVQVHGEGRMIDLVVAETVTESQLRSALSAAGVQTGPEWLIFVDEAEEHVSGTGHRSVPGVKHGTRIHVSRCRRIKVSVHFLDKTIEREFPPGTRLRTVKRWAAHEFNLDATDAAEHVLQICNSTERPASDTVLHVLVREGECAACFDLVPEKRVEG